MSYQTIEGALETIIVAMSGYTSKSVSKGDYRILKLGITRAVVLQPGPFIRETVAMQYIRTQWVINVELYETWGGEISTVAAAIRADRQSLIDEITAYPTLNNTEGVVLALVTGGQEPEVWADGKRYMWRQVIQVEVEERTSITYK